MRCIDCGTPEPLGQDGRCIRCRRERLRELGESVMERIRALEQQARGQT